MNCSTVERFADAVLDGELDASARIEVEQHLSQCAACRERVSFAEWMKASVQRATSVAAPAALRDRVRVALADEGAGRTALLDGSWRSTLAVAAAALLVFGLGGVLELRGPKMQAGVAALLEDVVRAHDADYPAEVARRDQVPGYFAERVGFPVRSIDFGDPSVRFVGARATEVGGRHAVMLQYDQRGRRMTVVAFRRPARAEHLGETTLGSNGQPLRLVRVGGHLVPLVEHDGVLYAVVGDLGADDGVLTAARAAQH